METEIFNIEITALKKMLISKRQTTRELFEKLWRKKKKI